MSFGVSLITFSPNSTIKSADVNSNFANLNNATDFQGNWDTATSGVSLYVSDESVNGVQSINIKPSPASPARTVTLSSRDGSGVQHTGLYIDIISGQVQIIGSIGFPVGTISRIGNVTGSGSATVNHNFSANPTGFAGIYAGNFGTAPTQAMAYYNATSSQVTVVGQAGYGWTLFLMRN